MSAVGVREVVNVMAAARTGTVVHRAYRDRWEDGQIKLYDRAICGAKPKHGWIVITVMDRVTWDCERCHERELNR